MEPLSQELPGDLDRYAGVLAVGVHLFVIGYQEPTLQSRFGDGYAESRRHVWRWIPRRPRPAP